MDNHYTKFPNYLFTELYQADMSGASFRVFLFIYRMTAGYQKDSDRLSISTIAKETGLSKASVKRSLSLLQKEGWIKLKSQKVKGCFFETNLISIVRGRLINEQGGRLINDTNSVSELSQYPLKGKESPFNDGRFIAPSLKEKKNILTQEDLDSLGDEYE